MANTTPTTAASSGEIQTIEKIIGKDTPAFIAKPIIAAANGLEEFRKNDFNNPYIFYFVLLFFVVIIVRFFWRLIF